MMYIFIGRLCNHNSISYPSDVCFTGGITLAVSFSFQLVHPYFLANNKVSKGNKTNTVKNISFPAVGNETSLNTECVLKGCPVRSDQ